MEWPTEPFTAHTEENLWDNSRGFSSLWSSLQDLAYTFEQSCLYKRYPG